MGKKMDGKSLSEMFCRVLREDVTELKLTRNIMPKLTVVYENDNGANRTYFKSILKRCKELKIYVDIKYFDELDTTDVIDICDTIRNPIIFLGNIRESLKKVISIMLPPKFDVDCWTTHNRGELLLNTSFFFNPCTPTGIVELLAWNVELEGKKVLIIGRGDLVGRPLACMLEHEDCTVTLAHSKTQNLFLECVRSDIIISCTGDYKALQDVENGLLTCYKHTLKDKVIVDVGTNIENGHMRGDFSEGFKSNFGLWTPKSNCIGAMTTAMLCRNVIDFYKKHY